MALRRYIDDLYSAGILFSPQVAYGMDRKITAEGESVVYLGVKVYIMKHGTQREVFRRRKGLRSRTGF